MMEVLLKYGEVFSLPGEPEEFGFPFGEISSQGEKILSLGETAKGGVVYHPHEKRFASVKEAVAYWKQWAK